MTNTYLLEVIKALPPIKEQEMALLLASPVFNRAGNAKELAKLYQIILNAAPDFSEDLLSKEKVYLQIFPDKQVVHRKLDKLMTDLNKVLRVYALIKRYLSDSNEEQQQIDWASCLREFGLADRSKQTIAKIKAKMEGEKAESLELYRTKLMIAEEEHMWEVTFNETKSDLNIPSLIRRLDFYYHNYRTDRANRYLLQQKVAQLPDVDFNEIGLDAYLKESVLLQISQKISEVLRKDFPSVEETQNLMLFLRDSEQNLSFLTLDHSYAYLRNSCTFLINGGNLEFIPILHEIHKDNLERGYFFLHGKIQAHAYLNLVQIATRAKEYEWAVKFTDDFKELILGGDEEQFFHSLNKAQCLFAEGNFEKALDYIPDAPSSFSYHHVVRRLELKIYYELRSDLLSYKVDSFRKYLERTAPKMIAATLRTMYNNFLNILLQLSQSPIKDKARSAKVVKRIEEKKLLAERSWLLEKARELG